MEKADHLFQFLKLPYELQQEILINLDYRSISNFCEAAKQTECDVLEICRDERFWKKKTLQEFPECMKSICKETFFRF